MRRVSVPKNGTEDGFLQRGVAVSLVVSGGQSVATTGGKKAMKKLVLKLRILTNTSGQDLIEYALMAGFVAVAAGALMPGVATSISQIFSQVASVMTAAASQGS
jgi:pilus assembly protein Flp/PilA